MTAEPRRTWTGDDYAMTREILASRRNIHWLREQLALRVALASYGWYEIPEPEGNGGEALAHKNDLETYIVGWIRNDGVTLDPGEDYVNITVSDYPSFREFVAALRVEFDRLVKEWYPE